MTNLIYLIYCSAQFNYALVYICHGWKWCDDETSIGGRAFNHGLNVGYLVVLVACGLKVKYLSTAVFLKDKRKILQLRNHLVNVTCAGFALQIPPLTFLSAEFYACQHRNLVLHTESQLEHWLSNQNPHCESVWSGTYALSLQLTGLYLSTVLFGIFNTVLPLRKRVTFEKIMTMRLNYYQTFQLILFGISSVTAILLYGLREEGLPATDTPFYFSAGEKVR